jgi:hypothetical protein
MANGPVVCPLTQSATHLRLLREFLSFDKIQSCGELQLTDDIYIGFGTAGWALPNAKEDYFLNDLYSLADCKHNRIEYMVQTHVFD